MAETRVRCSECGAKNSDPLVDRCRICGGLLPDAARRRAAALGATAEGPAFSDLVDNEVTAWKEYAAGRNRPGARSRRPPELDNPRRSRWSLRRAKET